MSYNPLLPAGQATASASNPVVIASNQTPVPIKSTVTTLYRASAVGTGISINDELQRIDVWDTSSSPVTLSSTRWYNNTTSANLASAPVSTSIYPVIGGILGTNGIVTSGTGSITAGGTAQVLFAANAARQGWRLQNTSQADLFVEEAGATATNASYRIAPGAEYNPPFTTTTLISIFGLTTGQTFIAQSWNVPNTSGTTLFVQGQVPAGQQPMATSFPVAIASNQTSIPVTVPVGQGTMAASTPVVLASDQSVISVKGPSNYTESNAINWYANIAGTGFAIGDILQSTIKSYAGAVSSTWFNITQGTQIATPSPAIVASNLVIYNPVFQAEKRPRNKWIISLLSYTSTTGNAIAIRNTNSFNVRIASFEYSMLINAPASSSQSQNVPFIANIGIGTTTVTGGNTVTVYKQSAGTYALDSSITCVTDYTSSTQTTAIPIAGWVQYIPSYQQASGFPVSSAPHSSHDWASGLIIPAGGTFRVFSSGFASLTTNSYFVFSITLTEE